MVAKTLISLALHPPMEFYAGDPGHLPEESSSWRGRPSSSEYEMWGVDSPLRVTGMMVTARVANLGRAQRAPLEMRAAGEKNASFEPFFKGGKQNFEDSFLQPWPATSAFCSQCWS